MDGLGRLIQKNRYSRTPLSEVYNLVNLTEAETGRVVSRGCGEGKRGSCCSIGIKFQKDE